MKPIHCFLCFSLKLLQVDFSHVIQWYIHQARSSDRMSKLLTDKLTAPLKSQLHAHVRLFRPWLNYDNFSFDFTLPVATSMSSCMPTETREVCHHETSFRTRTGNAPDPILSHVNSWWPSTDNQAKTPRHWCQRPQQARTSSQWLLQLRGWDDAAIRDMAGVDWLPKRVWLIACHASLSISMRRAKNCQGRCQIMENGLQSVKFLRVRLNPIIYFF